MDEVDLIDKMKNTEIKFKLCPELWNKEELDWSEFTFFEKKFLNDDVTAMHQSMDDIPSNTGGIYLFFIRPGIIPNFDYLVYIGRAQYTSGQNLKKRCRSYFQKYPKERPKINWMIREWGPYLHIKYIELTDNDTIKDLEKKLINSLIPPFNDEIPNKTIKRAVDAF
ncbi:hypothetical protein [Paenibacillus peoriae]|uniref:hypothetical protein n=1 Tax=Paenibacillus peoriae TaxID=59893 RepID=UPI00096DE147|nr:hypothetical protein [Paenibacillus peoriae]OMF34935.1 hypothetical protein BK134_06760 [Paenibacillus peoriae]